MVDKIYYFKNLLPMKINKLPITLKVIGLTNYLNKKTWINLRQKCLKTIEQ